MGILKAHRFARRVSKDELPLEETAPLLNSWRSWSSARPCNDEFGVVHGYVETVHSFTNEEDQQQTLENIRRTYKAGDTDLACRDTRDVQLSRPAAAQVAELTQPGQPRSGSPCRVAASRTASPKNSAASTPTKLR